MVNSCSIILKTLKSITFWDRFFLIFFLTGNPYTEHGIWKFNYKRIHYERIHEKIRTQKKRSLGWHSCSYASQVSVFFCSNFFATCGEKIKKGIFWPLTIPMDHQIGQVKSKKIFLKISKFYYLNLLEHKKALKCVWIVRFGQKFRK